MKREILISADGSPTIKDGVSGATYHSRHGALSESAHIFINNGLLYAAEKFGRQLSVLEAGFGSGLNTAITLMTARTKELGVDYTAIEKFPLPLSLAEEFRSALPDGLSGDYNKVVCAGWNRVEYIGKMVLKKIECDFCSWEPAGEFNVVYFDAFAPAVAPELWEEENFSRLASCMKSDAALVTFCAQGEVRRWLKRTGFAIERLPGAPGKLEMTRAIRLRTL